MKNFEILLKDMSHNTRYAFLEQGSDDAKLTEIASKFGVQLPANDLAIFKGTYAYVDRTNLNGCSLPDGEVTKALATLRGKAVDFDHLRKRVVGYFLDAERDGDEITCYGIFFKGNFPEDYDIIKDCMAKGTLGISFEAWGQHQARDDGDYDLIDIEFAGGALLIASDPAFPGAGVLELSKLHQAKVLEFAKVMIEPKEHIHEKGAVNTEKKTAEKASYSAYEFDMVLRALAEVPWHKGEEESWREVSLIDFTNNKVVVTYQPSGTEVSVDLTPSSKVTKKGTPVKVGDVVDAPIAVSFIESFQKFDGNFDELEAFVQKEMDYKTIQLPELAHLSIKDRTKLNDSDFAVIKKIKNITSGKRRKVRMFPLNDATHVRIALARLEQDNVKDTFTQLGISFKTVQQRILKKAKELKMKDIMEKYEQATTDEQVELYAKIVKETASLKTQIQELTDAQVAAKTASDDAITAKDTELASIQTKVEEITVAKDTAQAELDRRDEEIKVATLTSRKETLGDSAKGMEDADILDETKYEMALLKKENAELKAAAKPLLDEKGNEIPAEEKDGTENAELTKGNRDKDAEDEVTAVRKRVLKRAYGDDSEAK